MTYNAIIVQTLSHIDLYLFVCPQTMNTKCAYFISVHVLTLDWWMTAVPSRKDKHVARKDKIFTIHYFLLLITSHVELT